jgi:hypothetical protein
MIFFMSYFGMRPSVFHWCIILVCVCVFARARPCAGRSFCVLCTDRVNFVQAHGISELVPVLKNTMTNESHRQGNIFHNIIIKRNFKSWFV